MNLKKSLIYLSLIILLFSAISFAFATENNTDILEYQTEDITIDLENNTDLNEFQQLQTSNNEVSPNTSESDKLQLSDEDVLSRDYISDQSFVIDPTKTKNYANLTISGIYKTIYLAKGWNDFTKYTPKCYSTFNGNKYSRITIELPQTEGKYEYRLAADYLTLANIDYFNINVKYASFLQVTNANVDIGKQATINLKSTANSYYVNNITIIFNGKKYTLTKGSTKFTTTINKPGHYVGTAKLNLNGYPTSSEQFYIDVFEEPIIISQDYHINVLGKENYLNIYVVDSNGDPINGGTLYLNKNGAPVKNGYAQFTFNPNDVAIDYYSVKYSPSYKYYKTVSINNAFPIATISLTKLKINTLNTIGGSKIKKVKYTITDALGDKINPSGYFLINGKKYKSLKDFKAPKKAGTLKYKVKFVPDLILYGSSTTTLKIVNKLKTKIKAKSVSGYENKKVKITAIVKDNFGKKVKKGTVIFKFRGKQYKVKVKNGKAKKTIKIPEYNNRGIFYKYPKGKVTKIYDDVTFKGKVSLLGNKHYLKSSSSFKVTSIKKSKTEKYTPRYIYEGPGETSHKTTKKTKKQNSYKKKKKTYGYYPTYHKPIPKLNVNLFKKQPAVNPNTNLNNIVIIA